MASIAPNPPLPVGYQGEDFTPDKVPERLKDDCMVTHFRSRILGREERLESFEVDVQVRIVEEVNRIERLRKNLAEDERTKPEIDKLTRLREVWRFVAIESGKEDYEKVKVSPRPFPIAATPEERAGRQRLELNILRAVTKWVQEEPTKQKEAEPLPKEPEISLLERIFSERFLDFIFRTKKVIKKKKPENVSQPYIDGQEKQFRIPEDSYGIRTTQITLKKAEKSTFFSQKEIKRHHLKEFLEKESDNPLKKVDDRNIIRYFHIPTNNMHWVEEAIARYYDEGKPEQYNEFNYKESEAYRTKASNILCRKHWTSLQHGGIYDPVHARHLRPHCSLVTPENGSSTHQIKGSKNFILFMPYLHWETHLRRKKMAEITREITRQHNQNRPHVTESRRNELEDCTEMIIKRHARQLTGLLAPDATKKELEEKEAKKKKKKITEVKASYSLQMQTKYSLGDYFLQAAKVYEMMNVEPDIRVLRDHLHKSPPLHGRRTLDQSFYWKLHTTDGRDEDQVVYRATKTGKSILRTSKVIMVDQLWMYVLDDNTVITSFPKRWGRNKPDWSGVHKAIRERLKHLKDGEVQSVYDLALLIIDQCSAVFFDRSKALDERPEVLDIFSDALSHVSGMKTVAYESFWRQLNKLSARDNQHEDFEPTARIYLNINPEGELLRETHDIIEEIRMMKGIFDQQIHVIEEFSRHLQNLHEKETFRESTYEDASPTVLKVLMDIQKLLSDQRRAANPLATPPSDGNTPEPDGSQPASAKTAGDTIPKHTLHLAADVTRDMKYRRHELERLEKSTVYVCDQLKSLLDLKQQQASIIEAKYALKRADEGVTQGRSIMLFTIITIIFLPLSFMSSVFGMNASEFTDSDGNTMSLRHQFRLLFPISVGVIFVSLSLAFSTWIRHTISFITGIATASFFEYTYLRRIWNFFAKDRKSQSLYTKQQKIVERIYSRKERAEMLRDWAAAKLREKADKDKDVYATGDIVVEDGHVGNGQAASRGFEAALHSNRVAFRAEFSRFIKGTPRESSASNDSPA